jgi:hypothetical protein
MHRYNIFCLLRYPTAGEMSSNRNGNRNDFSKLLNDYTQQNSHKHLASNDKSFRSSSSLSTKLIPPLYEKKFGFNSE